MEKDVGHGKSEISMIQAMVTKQATTTSFGSSRMKWLLSKLYMRLCFKLAKYICLDSQDLLNPWFPASKFSFI